MMRRAREDLNKLFEQNGIDWVRENVITGGGEINMLEIPYARVWIENKQAEISRNEKKVEKRAERFWNLAFLVIGALIAMLSTYGLNKIEDGYKKRTIVRIIRSDVQKHIDYLSSTIDLLTNIKNGAMLTSKKDAENADAVIAKSNIRIDVKLRSHKSLVLEVLVKQLDAVPAHVLPYVLDFYRSLDYCEEERIKSNETFKSIPYGEMKSVPSVEAYLEMMKMTLDQGKTLLKKLH